MNNKKNPSMSFKEFTRPIRRNIGIIIFSFTGVILSISLLTFTAKKTYEAKSILFIAQGRDFNGQIFNVSNVITQKYMTKNQITVLKSRNLAAEVIRRLQESIHKDSISLLGNKPPRKTLRILDKILPFIQQKDTIKKDFPLKELVKNFRKATKVLQNPETNILDLRGRAQSAWEAAFIVNKWVEVYQEFDRLLSQSDVTQTKIFLEAKLKEIENKLKSSERNLTDFKKMKKVVSLSQETEQLVAQLSGFESLYHQSQTELEATENQLDYLKNQLDRSKRNLVEDMIRLSNPVLQELQKQMAQMVAEKAAYEAQLAGVGYSFKNDSRHIQMEGRLKGIKMKIIEETNALIQRDLTRINPLDRSENLITQILELETTQKSLSTKADALEKIVSTYTDKLASLPEKSLTLAQLERDVQVNREIYVLLRQKYEECRIREAGQAGLIRVVDRAEPPENPIHPRVKLNLVLACFFGLLLGMGLAFTREYFEDSIKDSNELIELGVNFIGSIPAIKKTKLPSKPKKDWKIIRAKAIYPYLLTNRKRGSAVAEAYRVVRTSIYFTIREKKLSTLLFTSPGPYEGKSTTVANISIAMAQKGIKTLLIDSDLRQPVLDVLFTGSRRKQGLTTYFSGKVDWKKAIRETVVQKLDLLAAGPGVKNAPELIDSKLMRKLISEVKKEYGIILLDSPPILPVADAAVLGSVVDGVILVVRAEKTSKEALMRSLKLIKKIKTEFLGIVMTGVDESDLYGYPEYYHPHESGTKKKD
jgi:capsular exopolysaccharide synthesis family protein